MKVSFYFSFKLIVIIFLRNLIICFFSLICFYVLFLIHLIANFSSQLIFLTKHKFLVFLYAVMLYKACCVSGLKLFLKFFLPTKIDYYSPILLINLIKNVIKILSLNLFYNLRYSIINRNTLFKRMVFSQPIKMIITKEFKVFTPNITELKIRKTISRKLFFIMGSRVK